MSELQIVSVVPKEKRRVAIRFENGVEVTLYRSELRGLPLQEGTLLTQEGSYIPEELYQKILTEVVGIRANISCNVIFMEPIGDTKKKSLIE